jgi:hypothetical protein
MWEPRRLTTLWAFTACYGDSFNFCSLRTFVGEQSSLRFYALPSSCDVSVLRVICVAVWMWMWCYYLIVTYTCLHAVALVECVSLIIMNVKLTISSEERKTFSRKTLNIRVECCSLSGVTVGI